MFLNHLNQNYIGYWLFLGEEAIFKDPAITFIVQYRGACMEGEEGCAKLIMARVSASTYVNNT